MRKNKLTLTSLLVPLIVCALVISSASEVMVTKAQNPYVGGYYSEKVRTTLSVYMVSYIMVDASKIPEGNRVETLLTVAGGYRSGSNVYASGYIYQAAWEVLSGGRYIMVVNVWYKDNVKIIRGEEYRGSPFEVAMYVYMKESSVLFVFEADGDTVWTYRVNKSLLGIHDEFFLVGSEKVGNTKIKFMQFGTEAVQKPLNIPWHVYQYQIYYYDTTSGYTWGTAYSTQGTTSYIIPYYVIGGATYRGVDYKYYPSDYCYDMGTLEWYWKGGDYILPSDTYLFPGP